MRSGNGPLQFKQMGASPAKQLTGVGTKGNYGLTTDFLKDAKGNKISKKNLEAQPFSSFPIDESKNNKVKPQKIDIVVEGVEGSKTGKGKRHKVGETSTSSRPEDNATPEQRMGSDFVTSKPKPNKTKATKTKTNKNTASKDKTEATKSSDEKTAKKTDLGQEFRDAGAIIASIPQGKSMVETQQKIADRKTSLTDKSNARKDKDIQNAKDIANTERTNQVIAEHTANLNEDSGKLPADNPSTNSTGESSVEKVKNKKTANVSYADGNDSYTTPDEMLKKSRNQ